MRKLCSQMQNKKHNKSIKFARKIRWLGGGKRRRAGYL